MRPAVLDNLPWRIAGLLLLGILVVVYQPEQSSLVHRLVIPVGMGVATWMLVQNLAAVTLGAGLLAVLHSAPGSGDWITALAYPTIAGICAVIFAGVMLARFRHHMAATREERWRRRRSRQDSDG